MRRSPDICFIFRILIFLGFLPSTSHGATTLARTLWDLSEEAEAIVLAHVDQVGQTPPSADGSRSRNSDLAALSVQQVLKGTPTAAILVEYRGSTLCQVPPEYIVGTQVLAFLRKNGPHYLTVAMSQGTLSPKPGELDDYLSVVQEAVALQAARPMAQDAKIRWMVHAAARPATRLHGLGGLVHPTSYLRGGGKNWESAPKSPDGIRLTPEQFKEIADSFVKYPTTGHSLPMILALLEHYASKAIDHTAIGLVDAALAEDVPAPWLIAAIDLLRSRLRDPMLATIPSPTVWENVPITVLRQGWQAVRKRLRLPQVAPIKAPAT